jgi:hypothetical protein
LWLNIQQRQLGLDTNPAQRAASPQDAGRPRSRGIPDNAAGGVGGFLKSLSAKDGADEPPAPGHNGERNLRGQKRCNNTHLSTTDPEAKLCCKDECQPA